MNEESITATATKINSTLLLQLHFLITSQLQIRKWLDNEIFGPQVRRQVSRQQGLLRVHILINQKLKCAHLFIDWRRQQYIHFDKVFFSDEVQLAHRGICGEQEYECNEYRHSNSQIYTIVCLLLS